MMRLNAADEQPTGQLKNQLGKPDANPALAFMQVVALCEALRGSSPARLVLSYELGNTAAKAVAQLMQPCSDYEDAAEGCKQGLLDLELSSNQITAEGAAALADALAQPECTLQVGGGADGSSASFRQSPVSYTTLGKQSASAHAQHQRSQVYQAGVQYL